MAGKNKSKNQSFRTLEQRNPGTNTMTQTKKTQSSSHIGKQANVRKSDHSRTHHYDIEMDQLGVIESQQSRTNAQNEGTVSTQ